MLFWLIAGVLLGAGAIFLRRNPNVKLAWFDWVFIVVAVLFFAVAIENYSGSMSELEPRAAGFLLISFGLPGLILTAIVAIRAWRSSKKPASA